MFRLSCVSTLHILYVELDIAITKTIKLMLFTIRKSETTGLSGDNCVFIALS